MSSPVRSADSARREVSERASASSRPPVPWANKTNNLTFSRQHHSIRGARTNNIGIKSLQSSLQSKYELQ